MPHAQVLLTVELRILLASVLAGQGPAHRNYTSKSESQASLDLHPVLKQDF